MNDLWLEYSNNTVQPFHSDMTKNTQKSGGIKASKLHQENKREVMLQGGRRYSLPLVGYSRLFPKKESCLKKKMPWIPVNASENQASYSCCQLIQARLGTHQSARPRPRQPLTCLPFQHKMETVPKVPIKISICDVCAVKKNIKNKYQAFSIAQEKIQQKLPKFCGQATYLRVFCLHKLNKCEECVCRQSVCA